MKKEKKLPVRVACVLLAVLLLAGCAGNELGTPGTPLPAAASSSITEQPPSQSVQLGITALLPAFEAALGEVLSQVAAENGLELTVDFAVAGPGYARAVANALTGQSPPDIIFLSDESEFDEAGGGRALLDLQASASLSSQALAAMVQPMARLEEEPAVYGLPTGYNALGYLVNIDLLAGLLGTQNPRALLNDLAVCSYSQWRLMIISLEQYLSKPGRIQITLGDTRYFTPSYRPVMASGLRGMFAVPDRDAGAMLQSALPAALSAPYESAKQLAQTDIAIRSALAYPTLGTLMGLLEFETLHMSRPEGVVYRGEAYAEWEKLDTAVAEALFCDGTALFLRADYATGKRLEREAPTLSGKLALVPIKLPIPVPAAAESGEEPDETNAPDDSTENADTPDEGQPESGVASTPLSEETPASETLENDEESIDVREAIARQNQKLWMTGAGALCLNKQSDANESAHLLLLYLFGSANGLRQLQALDTLPYIALGTNTNTLNTQLYAALDGAGAAWLPQKPAEYQSAQVALGEYVLENLLHLDEWDEEAIDGFLSTGLVAMGLRANVPEVSQPPGDSGA